MEHFQVHYSGNSRYQYSDRLISILACKHDSTQRPVGPVQLILENANCVRMLQHRRSTVQNRKTLSVKTARHNFVQISVGDEQFQRLFVYCQSIWPVKLTRSPDYDSLIGTIHRSSCDTWIGGGPVTPEKKTEFWVEDNCSRLIEG